MVNQTVPIAVGTDFVTGTMDVMDEPRKTFCHPAQHKKAGLHLLLFQQPQHAVRIGNHPAFKAIPVFAIDMPLEGTDLEIVFDVDGEGVDQSAAVTKEAVSRTNR